MGSQVRARPLTCFENLNFVKNLLFPLLKNSKSVVDERSSLTFFNKSLDRKQCKGYFHSCILVVDMSNKNKKNYCVVSGPGYYYVYFLSLKTIYKIVAHLWLKGAKVFKTYNYNYKIKQNVKFT